MYKKMIFLISCIVVNFNIISMDSVNKRNAFGHTPLHIAAMTPDEIITCFSPYKDLDSQIIVNHMNSMKNDLLTYDTKSAKTAGMLYQIGANISIKDNENLTPFDYAKRNKEQLPQVFVVLNAMNIIKTVHNKLPQPGEHGYTLEQLMNIPYMPSEELIEWQEAENVLAEYSKE